jgi:hypothetical protein
MRKRERFAGHVARMEEKRNCYSTLVDKLEGNRLLGRPRPKWENNIKKRDDQIMSALKKRDCYNSFLKCRLYSFRIFSKN